MLPLARARIREAPRGLHLELLEGRYLLSAAGGWDVALIDRTLPDSQTLINAALGSTRVITYDGAHESPQDVLGRVIQWVGADGRKIGSLSVFSHGAAGRFELGDEFISARTLRYTARLWSQLRGAFADGATLQIYGCDTADGISGQKLLRRLSHYTGVAVFGSTNITGRGGDWVLEDHSTVAGGTLPNAHLPLDSSELANYQGRLVWIGATSGTTNDAAHDYNNPANWAGGTIDDSFSGVTFSGNTTLYFSADRTTGAGGLNLNYSGAFDLTLMSNSATARTLTLGGGISGDFGTSSNNQTVTIGDSTNALNINLNAAGRTFTVTGAGDSLVVPNVISNGTLTKAGSGTLTLSGANTFSNTLTVSAGTLTQSAGSASPSTFSISSGATLNVNGGTLSISTPTTINGTLNIGGGTLSITAAVSLTNAGTVNISSGTLQWTVIGGGADYKNSGGASTNISGGLLKLGHDYQATSLNARGGTVEFQSSPGAGNMKNGPYQFYNLTIDPGVTVPFNNAAITVDIAGDFTNNGGANWGSSTAVFNGFGTQTIGGSASTAFHNFTLDTFFGFGTVTMAAGLTTTVSGTTTLSLGTLLVDGTFSPSANLTVPAGVTLGGNGTVTTSRSISVTGGRIAPGDDTGTLTTGPLTFSSGSPSYSVLLSDVGGTITSDKVSVTGTAALGTSLTRLDLRLASGFSPRNGDQFTILTASTSRTGTFTNAASTITVGGATFSVTYNPTSVVLTYQASATALAFVQQPTNTTAGVAISPAVTVDIQDAFGTTISSDNSTVTLTISSGTFEGGSTTVTAVASNGVATFSNLRIDTLGTYTLTATDGSLANATSNSFTISNAPPTVATPAGATPSPATGTTTALSVLGADDGGESNLTYTWATTGTPPAAVSFSANGTNAAKNNTATFTKAGTYNFQVTITDGGGLSVTSSVSVTVNQTLTSIALTPAGATLNENGTQQLSATAYDQFGNAMATQPPFTWALISGSGSVDGSGLYTAPGSTGSATVQASSGSVHGTATITINNAAPAVATAASATPNPVTGTTTTLSVLGADDGGEANLTYTWTTTGTPPASVSFSSNGTNAAKTSTATFSKAGTYNFQVTITDAGGLSVTSSVTVTVNQTLTSIGLSPGSATLNENATRQFTATAYDQFGNALTSQPSFAWALTSGIGTVDSSGLYTAPGSTGSAVVQASSGSISGSAPVTVNNAAPTVATPASATPSPATGTTTALSVLGADDGGESNLTYTWATTGTPPAAVSFSANGTNAAKNTTATFTRAGTYNFQVTITDGGGLSVTSSVSVTVNQTLTSITVSPPSSIIDETSTQQLTALAYDQFGNVLSLQPAFTWSIASGIGGVDSSGLYTSPAGTGSATVQASSGSVSGTASITVTNAGPTVASAASANPNPVTASSTALSVLGADDAGEASLTYTWATTGTPPAAVSFSANGTNAAKNTTATFAKAGTYNFQVTITDGGGLSVTSSVSVTVNQTLTSIALTPAGATLNENGTQQFSATAYDQFGNAMGTQPGFTWALISGSGSVDSSGLYTAPGSTGSATVQATSGSVHGTATLTINNAAPTVATSASATPNPVTGTTTALSVLGADDGGEANLTYAWNTTGTPPAPVSFSSNGTNAAKNTTATFTKAGTYNFQVTITDGGGLSVTSSVSVTVNQTLTSITLTPAGATLNENGTQQFSATAYDQFGNSLGTQPGFTWSISSGIGTVNASGLYTAPAAAGSAVVRATSGSTGGTASVTINNAVPTVATPANATPSPVTGTTTALSVLGADDGGESNLTYTWSTTGTPPAGVSFSANGTNAARNTTATFIAAGAYHFLVTVTDSGGLTTTSTVDVTVNQTFSTVAVTPASSSLVENSTQQFAATAYDQFGSPMLSQPAFTWSVSGAGAVDASGLYTSPGAPGSATVFAQSGAITGSAAVTVTSSPPTIATPAGASPNPVAGITTNLSVLGADDGGESNLTYTWSLTGSPPAGVTFSANGTNAAKNTTATFSRAGTYDFIVTITDGDGLTATSPISVTVNQTLTTITVSPAVASVNENSTQQFTAVAFDQFGNAMATQPAFTWTKSSGVGSIDAAGLYTSPTVAGSASVRADAGFVSGAASITINNAAPTIAAAASALPDPVTGTTASLNVLGADDGGEGNLTYTWSLTGSPPAPVSFASSGTNAAKNTLATFTQAGTYTFVVTATDAGGLTATSTVTVDVVQTLTSIVVAPAPISISENQTQSFSATAYDQFGTLMSAQPAFTWSAARGSIDSSGLYTAPRFGGGDTVTAASGAVSGTASISITNTPPVIVSPATATPDVVTATTTVLQVLADDDGGEAALSYQWSVLSRPAGAADPVFSPNATNAAKRATATFFAAGDYAFRVLVSDGTYTAVSDVTVTVVPTLTRISVTPGRATLIDGAAVQLSAVAYDQFGDALASPPPFTWSILPDFGTISLTGNYQAPANGVGRVVVQSSAGGVSGEAVLDVITPAPPVAPPAPPAPPVGLEAPPPQPDPTPDPTVTQSDSQPPPAQKGSEGGGTLAQHGSGTAAAPAPSTGGGSSAPQSPAEAPAPAQAPPDAAPVESAPEAAPSNPPGLKEPSRPAAPLVRGAAAVSVAARLARVEPTKLYDQLDTVAKEVQASRGVFGTTIQPGTIVTTTVTMSAGFLVWLTRGGSLLMSFLSALPMWRLLDPLPVLETWEKKRTSGKSKQPPDEAPEGPDDQEQRVRSLLESDAAKDAGLAGR